MLAPGVSRLSGGHVLSSGLLSLQKAGILKKMKCLLNRQDSQLLFFGLMGFFDWLIVKKCDPALSTPKIHILLTSPLG
jgi:hypothetical protein